MSHKPYVTVADADAMARGPTSSGTNLKRTIAAIAAAAMSVSAFTVAAANSTMNAEEKMIGKQSAVAAAKRQLVAGDRDGGYDKKMTAGQSKLTGLRETTEATPFACLKKIGNAMRRTTRHLDTGGPVALAISMVSA